MAVGATRGAIAAWISNRAGTPVAIGMLAGFALSLVTMQSLSGLLFGATPNDPATYAAVALTMLAAAALAIVLPARRASRVDPLVALRDE